MKRFQFRLASVEKHRKLQEQERQVWLAKCLERLRGSQDRLLHVDMDEVQARREFSALGSPSQRTSVNSSDFWILDQFIRGQQVRRLDLKKEIEQEEEEVKGAYRAFLHARQQWKIMEKLREKRFSQFSKEAQKHEARMLDEQYVTRFGTGKEMEDDEDVED